MIQSPPPAAPQAPANPAQAATPAPTAISRGSGTESNVYTARDIAMFRARGEELSRQLTSANSRRKSLQQSLRGAEGADKAGLEQRLGVLDARIARLEGDIEENGRALASPSASLLASQGLTRDRGATAGDYSGPISAVFIIFVMAPIAIAYARRVWRRGVDTGRANTSSETALRLERMEQAIDAVAIEMERVSEGQRFVTRLLAEGRVDGVAVAGQPREASLVSERQSPTT